MNLISGAVTIFFLPLLVEIVPVLPAAVTTGTAPSRDALSVVLCDPPCVILLRHSTFLWSSFRRYSFFCASNSGGSFSYM
jgi:hypothetical protein